MSVLVIFVTLLLVWEGSVFAQETMQGAYQPPPTLEQSMMGDSPFAQEMMTAAYTGTLPEFRVYAEKQAAHGEVLAQLFLGTEYIPAECTHQSYKTAPEDCPSDPFQKNALGVTPSFDEAIHWLQLASGRGNGEASEILAEVMDRAIHSRFPTQWKESDVARYHALARSQGYDFQEVEISCYTLESSQTKESLGMSSSTPAQFQLAPEVLGDLRTAGPQAPFNGAERQTSREPFFSGIRKGQRRTYA